MSASSAPMEQSSARYIRGIGPKRFEALNRLGVQTVRDLCYLFPRRHEDRTRFQPIGSIEAGSEVTIRGEVLTLGVRPLKQMNLFEMIVGDSSGMITAVWFNQPYLKNQFEAGAQVILSGKADRYQNRLQLNSPEYERVQDSEEEGSTVHTGRITPIYPLTEGLAQRSLRTAMKEVVDQHVLRELQEYLPDDIRERHNLMELGRAVQTVHFPESWDELEQAKKRIIFDEFFVFELMLLANHYSIRKKDRSVPLKCTPSFLNEFLGKLQFELTEGQHKVIREIGEDVSKEIPMTRLLQGEVGSGKTVVAAFFLYLAARSGLQSVLLAPTEILAEQHFDKLSPLLASFGVSSALVTGSLEAGERTGVREDAERGRVSVLIGTHALLQTELKFQKLGLVVIDEQHRFGVRQQGQLLGRNPRPHLLVMSATPIPRSLGLTLYGDFDISTIRELPRGRKPVKTYWIHQDKESEVLTHIRTRVMESGEQAYILFPVIDESERLDLQAASEEYEKLKRGIFKGIQVGLIHGRLEKRERDEVMRKFHSGTIKVLAATSVIEVGVDNPNVTRMVIENAERFGLSQLHQMRGRIGRSDKESVCFLFGSPSTEAGKKRLRILTKTNDGFAIAEEDLELRGPGDFFGTRQSGFTSFRLANFIRDSELLMTARKEAIRLLDLDFTFSLADHERLKKEIDLRRVEFYPPPCV